MAVAIIVSILCTFVGLWSWFQDVAHLRQAVVVMIVLILCTFQRSALNTLHILGLVMVSRRCTFGDCGHDSFQHFHISELWSSFVWRLCTFQGVCTQLWRLWSWFQSFAYFRAAVMISRIIVVFNSWWPWSMISSLSSSSKETGSN